MKFESKTFSSEEITLDSNEFVNCHFDRCTMVYNGAGPVGLSGCAFSNVNWVFAGAAQNTLQFMTSLYHGAGEGGRKIIEQTMENIKRAKYPRREQ